MKLIKHDETRREQTLFKTLGITALALLMLVSIAGAAPFAYITNYLDNTVSVIDTATNTVTSTVPVGSSPIGVAVTPDGTKVYVANSGANSLNGEDDGSVSVIDTAKNIVIATVKVGPNPNNVAVTPDGTKVYVTSSLFSYRSAGDTFVSVIDTATNTVTATVNVGVQQGAVAITPDGTKVYVTKGDATVSIIDTATNTVIGTVPVGNSPLGIAVTPDGSKVYVTNNWDGTVSVIDTATNTVTATVPLGRYSSPFGVAVTPDGTKVYVGDTRNNKVFVIDTATDTVTANVPLYGTPKGVAVTPDGTKVYVIDDSGDGSDDEEYNGFVSVIDVATNTVTATVRVGNAPMALGQFIGGNEISVPEGTNLYISNQAPESKSCGSSMTYTLYYSNFGNKSANNVVLEDKLPNDVEFESASDGGVYDSSTRTVRWNIGSVNSRGHGYRTLNISIPEDVPSGTIVNNASISTSDPEILYDDNEAQAKTRVTGLILPPNVGVEPNNGGTGITSIYWGTPVTFSYHSDEPATAVSIRIHFDDGGPDIIDNMTATTDSTIATENTMMATATSTTGSSLDWRHTTTFYPRHGRATVTYVTYYPRSNSNPYSKDYDVRGSIGNNITANNIVAYIKEYYPKSPMLKEFDIGLMFKNSRSYGIDPAFLVATAEHESNFGLIGWGASHPEAHNSLGYAVPSGSTPVNPNPDLRASNHARSWGAMVDRVEWCIVYGTHYFTRGHYTVDQIRAGVPHGKDPENAYAGDPQSDTIAIYMNKLYNFCKDEQAEESFGIYIDPAGYIYDVDTGNRIAGASVWLQCPDGKGGWENVSTGQTPAISQPDTNPLITNNDGQYQWDVLEGSYRVHVEAPGYEPVDSIVVSIPPPVYDLHVGLHHIYDPTVPPVLPVSNFSTDVSSGYAPCKVQFTDLSEIETGINWDFGDGTSSSDRYPTHTYSAPGIYTVNLTASNGNGVNSKTVTIDVQAVPIYPLASFICNVTEGYAPLSVQFTDLSENVNGISWDFGDGASSTDKNPVHTYFATGNYTATLTVSNDNGTSSSFAIVNVSEHRVTPPQSISNLQSSTGSTWINWTWTNPQDPDFNHTEIYLNGTFQTNTSAEYFNATGLEPETDYTIGTRTADINGNVNETWVNLTATTKKAPIIVGAGTDQTVEEGTSLDLKGSFTASGSHTYSYRWDFGDGSVEDSSLTTSHAYADDGIYTVNLTVTDEEGDFGNDTLTVTVNNVAPTVSSTGALISENGTATVSGTISDPGAVDTFEVEINWGDGNTETFSYPSGSTEFSEDHQYMDDDPSGTPSDDYTVTVTVTDDDTGEGTASTTVTVNNVAPDVDAGSDIVITAGNLVSFSGTFSDPGWLDTHTAEWNFGEGIGEAGSVSEENEYPDSTGMVSGSFSYFDAGEYTVTLSVTDDDGGIGEDQLTVTVLPIVATVDFDPDTLNLGSGGQWITAYIELPDGYDVAGIDASSVLLNGVVSAVTDPKYGFVKDKSEYLMDRDGDGIPERMLKFDRGTVEGILKAGDQVKVTFTGKVEYENEIGSSKASFEGSDLIKVIEKSSKKGNTKK